MAAKMKLLQYPSQILGNEAISWSKDNRISICTESGIIVLTIPYSLQDNSVEMPLHQTMIPARSDVFDISDLKSAEIEKFQDELDNDALSELILDTVMNPLNTTESEPTGYIKSAWSPLGDNSQNRSVLAVLSRDFRLCVYRVTSPQNKNELICDLSEAYVKQTVTKIEGIDKVRQLHDFKDWCYGKAVIAFCWYPALLSTPEAGKQYSILATGMKSGHIVLWKINMPCLSVDSCTVMSCDLPHSAHITAMCWSVKRGRLFIGYGDGQIHSLCYCLDTGQALTTPPTLSPVYTDNDGIPVSCLHVTTGSNKVGGELLLFSKSQYLFLCQLRTEGPVTVTHTLMENTLPGSDFVTLSDGDVLMTSLDGLLQRIKVVALDEKDVRVKVKKISFNLDESRTHSFHGVAISPQNIYGALVARISSFFDQFEVRQPTKVCVFPMTLDNLADDQELRRRIQTALLDETVGLRIQLDVLEEYRQILKSSKRIPEFIPQNLSPGEMSVKQLRLRRFSLSILSQTQKKKVGEDNSEIEELVAKWIEEMSTLAVVIFIRYIRDCVTNAKSSKKKLRNKDKEILWQMSQFLQSKPNLTDLNPGGAELTDTLTKLLASWKPRQQTCCICSADVSIDNFESSCSNGHKIGVCCKTFLPCTDFTYRTCSTCHSQSLDRKSIKDYPWLGGDYDSCTLCGSLLFES